MSNDSSNASERVVRQAQQVAGRRGSTEVSVADVIQAVVDPDTPEAQGESPPISPQLRGQVNAAFEIAAVEGRSDISVADLARSVAQSTQDHYPSPEEQAARDEYAEAAFRPTVEDVASHVSGWTTLDPSTQLAVTKVLCDRLTTIGGPAAAQPQLEALVHLTLEKSVELHRSTPGNYQHSVTTWVLSGVMEMLLDRD
jgi:hypothetical protein